MESRTVKVTQEGKLWVAVDKKTGIASQGATEHEALRALAEALELAATNDDWKNAGGNPTADRQRAKEKLGL